MEVRRLMFPLLGVPSLLVFCVGGFKGELTDVEKAWRLNISPCYLACSRGRVWMYLFLLISHLLHRYGIHATLMIPADIWPCGFLHFIPLAPSRTVCPIDRTWAPAIDKQVIDIRARECIPLMCPEQIKKLVLRVAAFSR